MTAFNQLGNIFGYGLNLELALTIIDLATIFPAQSFV